MTNYLVMKTRLLLLAASLLMVANASAQKCNGWNWPEDKATAETKYALYTDAKKNGDYRTAANNLSWILANAPDLNKSNYINGAQIYENLAKLEKDAAQKAVYQDSALLMYDLRIQYCNEEANVLNRKAFAAYQFHKDNKEKYADLVALFKKAYELNGDKVWDNNLVAYMFVVHKYKKANGDISDDEVLNVYDKIVGILDTKIAAGKNVDRLNKFKDQIDRLLTATVDIDCEFIENTLVPKLDQTPDDVALIKKVFGLSLTAKCTDNAFFLDVAKQLYEKEPNYGTAWTIGNKCMANEDFDCAKKYFTEAIEQTDDNTRVADMHYKLASIAHKQGSFSGARDHSLKAIQADPSRKEAYNLIANLYMNSHKTCREGEDKVKDRLVFLAAYDMYQKAGNSKGMQSAKEQFPSVEELFERNYTKGQTMSVGCWINQAVVLRTRD